MFLVVNTGQMYQLVIVIMQCAKSHDSNDKMATKCHVLHSGMQLISCVKLPEIQLYNIQCNI